MQFVYFANDLHIKMFENCHNSVLFKRKLLTKFKNHASCHLDIEKDESNLFHIISNNKLLYLNIQSEIYE